MSESIGHVTYTLDDEEISVLRNALNAWNEADGSAGWRNANHLSPDQYLVLDWRKLIEFDLLESNTLPGEFFYSGALRITKAGRDTLKAIDEKAKWVNRPMSLDDAYAKGRADAEREIQQQLYALFGDDCQWREANNVPVPLGALRIVKQALSTAKAKQFQLEFTLASRDKVDEWAAVLLETAAETHVANHGERRGHMTLVAALLRRYVGSRNVYPEPPDPDSIPF